MANVELKILSLGAGIQSSALYFMSALNFIPVKYDYAIFADTGRERKHTYTYLRYMIEWSLENRSIPIIWSGSKSIYTDLRNKKKKVFRSVPLYTKDTFGNIGMLKRQCTSEYKIKVVNNEIRKIQGLKKRQRYKPVDLHIGISIDEADRMSINKIKAFTNVYPLTGFRISNNQYSKLNYGLSFTKNDCASWLQKNGFIVPKSSACSLCPYQSDKMWLDLKINDPKEFKTLVKLDYELRNSTKKGIESPVYFHRSCVPLDKVEFNENQTELQLECSGSCHN